MKTKWLWTAWTHLMLTLVIALQVSWIAFAVIFLIPKFQKLTDDGIIDLAYAAADESWMASFLDGVMHVSRDYTWWLALGAVVVAGLFEWRVKSENKTFVRLSALGTFAAGLTVVSALVGASLASPQLLSGPVNGVMAETFAQSKIAQIDTALGSLEKSLAAKDWEAMMAPADRAELALRQMDKVAPAVRALWSRNSPSVAELRTHVKNANESMKDVGQAIVRNDADGAEAALHKLHQSFAPVRAAAKMAK